MKQQLKNPYLHLILGIVSILFIFYSYSYFSPNKSDISYFKSTLREKEDIANQKIDELISIEEITTQFANSKEYTELTKNKGISLFVIKNEKLVFWTNRSINFMPNLSEFTAENGAVKLKNGWYQYLLKKSNGKTYLALILIKHDYQITNKFLKNSFHESYQLNDKITIAVDSSSSGTIIRSKNGNYLFSLQKEDIKETNSKKFNWFIVVLFFLSYILIISFISKQTRKIVFLRNFSPLIVITFIIVSRLLLLQFPILKSLFNQELFEPTVFAQSAFLPSLGDLLISAILFSIIIYYLARAIKKINPYNKPIVFAIVITTAIFPLVLADLIEGLITNSKINFDINYFLDLSAYSFVGIGSVTTLFISFILFIKIAISYFLDKAFKRNQLIIIYWTISLLMVIIGHFFFEINALLTSWILLVILAFSFKTTSKLSFYRSAFIVIVVSITTSYGFIHHGEEKEKINKEFIAKKLAKERNPVAEYLFGEIKEKIETDTFVINNINTYWNDKSKIDNHIINRYFGGFWNKYDINIITPCQEIDSILIENKINVNCLTFFNNKIVKEVEDPFNINETLNFLYSDEGISSYLAKLKLINLEGKEYFLFIEFFPKNFSKTEGYPELLLNEKDVISRPNNNQYSYAKYKKRKLIDNAGKFNYSIELSDNFQFGKDVFYETNFGAANHIIYRSDKNTVVVLSSPEKTILYYITTFSYFLIITSLLVLIIGLFFKISPFNWQLALTDFSTKIQLFIITSIFLSFILFSWGTTYYIKEQYTEKNKTQLAEKVQSILIELEQKIGDKKALNASMVDEMTYYLVKFSNVFYTDINLYDEKGALLATSRPEIFERGLISKQMDSEAYHKIFLQKKSNYTHQENIGKLEYLSSYVPFRNDKNEILAYLNLPYFAKQNELENELSSFYTSLINIYGLLFLISTIIAVFFANYISEPLRMIKNKISALQLGKSYDLLEWSSNDEIGALVFEYNKKVVELEKNATLLIKSERESAWREMAKQVAHEIKNPLTPMKLGIQQLQKLANDDATDIKERINRTSKTLIEQIDTLTTIANEFSNFAKMPKTQEEKFNLIPIIETTLDLYQEKNIAISFLEKCNGEAFVVADKDQLSRVFSNLIKNAIQAIPEDKFGKIEVSVTIKDTNFVIKIKDNGTGIAENQKNKIFVPNFTTKSTGMGLGLAMVKNSIENANGKIWFETQENIGTSFFIELPIN